MGFLRSKLVDVLPRGGQAQSRPFLSRCNHPVRGFAIVYLRQAAHYCAPPFAPPFVRVCAVRRKSIVQLNIVN